MDNSVYRTVHPTVTSHSTLRKWAAIISAFAVIFTPLIALSQANASPAGYQGTLIEGFTWGDSFLEGQMVEGVTYSANVIGSTDCRDWATSGSLPPGLGLNSSLDPVLSISGTPTTAGDYSFSITGYGEAPCEMAFTVTVDTNTSPTTTALTVAGLSSYDSIALSALVSGNPAVGGLTPSGSVEFYAEATLIGTGTLDATGTATATGILPISSTGTTPNITAKYLGDTNYAVSTSTAAPVLIYAPTVSGVVLTNGQPVSGVAVELRDADTDALQNSTTTNGSGAFTLAPGTIASSTDAAKNYVIRATMSGGLDLYYAAGGHDVTDIAAATPTSPTTWSSSLTIQHYVAPVWSDTDVFTPRVGSSYSDGVSATSPNAVSYTVSAGSLPGGLNLNSASGEIAGTPTVCTDAACDFTFIITASNGYGSVQQAFMGTVLPVGVAPTWTDATLPDLQVSTAVTDGVVAAGDPTIVYAISAGTLPAGVTFSTIDGTVTGKPTTEGAYSFSITATNDFGTIQADFTGTVAAAPVIDLTLDFAAGTPVGDATSTISASGLQVGSDYTLTMFSTPVVLYTGVIGPGGGFTWTVSIPAGTPPGAHRLLLSGIAPDGSTMTAQAWFTLLPNGTIGAISYSGPLPYATLAYTGSDIGGPMGVGFGLITLGLVAILSRRRRTATR